MPGVPLAPGASITVAPESLPMRLTESVLMTTASANEPASIQMVSPAVANNSARVIVANGTLAVPLPVAVSDPPAYVKLSAAVATSFTYQFTVEVNTALSDGCESEKNDSFSNGDAVSKAVTR